MIETIGAVVLVAIGYFLGFIVTKANKTKAPDFTPRCQCGHVYSIHKKGYRCQSDDTIRKGGVVDKFRTCPCTIYVGPDPMISGLWSPPTEK